MIDSLKKSDEHELEQLVNDAQILFDEADDVPLQVREYEKKLGIYLISPSSYLADPKRIQVAKTNLQSFGFKVKVDKCATEKYLRFAGTDIQRAKSFTRAIKESKAPIIMPTRGGYGLTRILPLIDWKLLAENPRTYCGYSDFTAFNLALLAKTGLPSFTGPNAVSDFGSDKLDELTTEIFVEMMRGELEILSFVSEESDSVDETGVLWGGNLALLTALLGTPYFPKIKKGILFLEDVSEHPYRVERLLIQLHQAGVLKTQKAIVLGDVSDYQLVDNDNGFSLISVIEWLRKTVKVPVVTGLPYGHGEVRVTLPIGKKVGLATEDGMAHLVIDKHNHLKYDSDHHTNCLNLEKYKRKNK